MSKNKKFSAIGIAFITVTILLYQNCSFEEGGNIWSSQTPPTCPNGICSWGQGQVEKLAVTIEVIEGQKIQNTSQLVYVSSNTQAFEVRGFCNKDTFKGSSIAGTFVYGGQKYFGFTACEDNSEYSLNIKTSNINGGAIGFLTVEIFGKDKEDTYYAGGQEAKQQLSNIRVQNLLRPPLFDSRIYDGGPSNDWSAMRVFQNGSPGSKTTSPFVEIREMAGFCSYDNSINADNTITLIMKSDFYDSPTLFSSGTTTCNSFANSHPPVSESSISDLVNQRATEGYSGWFSFDNPVNIYYKNYGNTPWSPEHNADTFGSRAITFEARQQDKTLNITVSGTTKVIAKFNSSNTARSWTWEILAEVIKMARRSLEFRYSVTEPSSSDLAAYFLDTEFSSEEEQSDGKGIGRYYGFRDYLINNIARAKEFIKADDNHINRKYFLSIEGGNSVFFQRFNSLASQSSNVKCDVQSPSENLTISGSSTISGYGTIQFDDPEVARVSLCMWYWFYKGIMGRSRAELEDAIVNGITFRSGTNLCKANGKSSDLGKTSNEVSKNCWKLGVFYKNISLFKSRFLTAKGVNSITLERDVEGTGKAFRSAVLQFYINEMMDALSYHYSQSWGSETFNRAVDWAYGTELYLDGNGNSVSNSQKNTIRESLYPQEKALPNQEIDGTSKSGQYFSIYYFSNDYGSYKADHSTRVVTPTQ